MSRSAGLPAFVTTSESVMRAGAPVTSTVKIVVGFSAVVAGREDRAGVGRVRR